MVRRSFTVTALTVFARRRAVTFAKWMWVAALMRAITSATAATVDLPSQPAQSVAPASSGPAASGASPAASSSSAVHGQDDTSKSAAALKADYLYRFLDYVEFPKQALPQPDSPLVIGVAGADDVFSALGEVLPLRAVNSRAMQRRRLVEGDSLAGVQMVFVGHDVDLSQSQLVKAARANSVLLVTDAPDGLAMGAVFNFLQLGERLRFEVSLAAADRASLKISSRVLALAERVTGTH